MSLLSGEEVDAADERKLLFESLRCTRTMNNTIIWITSPLILAFDLNTIRNILQTSPHLLNSKLYGYEGTDIFDIIPNVMDAAKFPTEY